MCAKKKFITSNPELKTVKKGWTGNPLDEEGLYRNLYDNSLPSFKDFLKWQFGEKPQKQEKKKDTFRHKVITTNDFLGNKNDGITWFGHATFIIHINGYRIITDPIFWDIGIVKRLTALPCSPEDITNVDLILLSHNHRDHADERSMKLLCANNPKATILTGLQIRNLLQMWSIRNPIQEAGWYQQYNIKDLDITYLPARHWNRRYIWDTNRMLWGSFMIQSEGKTIYFGADSAYDKHFKEVGEMFPAIDISILGCGAYKPEWFMSCSHKSPEGALQAFHDTKAKTFIPMHIGTFDLSDEPISEPFRLLKEYEKENKINGELKILDIGESMNW